VINDASTSEKGKIQLAGDLSGTAAAPTVPDLALKANIASPTFTGTPFAPTATAGTSTTQIATTAFVAAAISTGGGGGGSRYLGEDYLGGIIYYIYIGSDNLQHGLIVSKTESSTEVWQATGVLVNADRTEDGVYNTILMTSSAAATYVTGLGAGWYLPSIDELNRLYNNRDHANKALRAGGFTLLSAIATYWSSTEANAPNATVAFAFNFNVGNANFTPKDRTLSVRGVRAF
jgi:hypothetical protein